MTVRDYRCLLDVTEITTRTADGTSVSVTLTAFVRSIPIGESAPRQILDNDKVEFLGDVGFTNKERPLVSVSTHFDADGTAHNFTLRFS
jgi:hypothetical protein